MEKTESGFSIARLTQKCFSTMQAPIATAVAALKAPIEWSESPTGMSKRALRSRIVARFISSLFAGYALEHFISASCLFPVLYIALTASVISSIVPIPVDRMTGLFLDAMYSSKGMSTSSNEAIL